MRFLPVNLYSFLIELTSLEESLALYDALCEDTPPGIEELVPAARTLLVRISRTANCQQLIQQIIRRPLCNRSAHHQQSITIAVRYDGEDLPMVAAHYGISVQELIARHQQTVWKVAFIGFAPGFAYLVPCAGSWQTPRRDTPRTRIPSGSVALAGEFSGVYPQASPGGWQLIGQTDCPIWDSHRHPPALLQPCAEVQFVDEKQIGALISVPATKPVASGSLLQVTGSGKPLLHVVTPGLQTSWQDAGRAGCAAMGITESGAMDKAAWRAANRLVGNPVSTPCLEMTWGGFRAVAQRDLVLALTGAPCPITLVADQLAYNVTFATPFSVAAGDEIIIGAPANGVRSYLAIRGGCQIERFLASAAWDSLAKVGPAPLCAGDSLLATSPVKLLAVQPVDAPAELLPAKGATIILDIIPGPRTDWFTEQALLVLTSQRWLVTPQSNRIGLRLQGTQPLEREQLQELPSEGTCCGAIQVAASGQPVLFLRDHPLTGGYPVIAAVVDYHLDLAGQIPPDAWIHFHMIRLFQGL